MTIVWGVLIMENYEVKIPENHYIYEYPKHWTFQISNDNKKHTKNFLFN